jgi:hypothetical protein
MVLRFTDARRVSLGTVSHSVLPPGWTRVASVERVIARKRRWTPGPIRHRAIEFRKCTDGRA